MNTKAPDFISMQPIGDSIRVHWQFTVFRKKEKNGRTSCYIPSFDIYFSSKENDKESIGRKGTVITRMFIDHFMIQKDIKGFTLEIHKRGFRTTNDAHIVSEFIKNNIKKAKFNFHISDSKEGYGDGIIQQSEIDVAA